MKIYLATDHAGLKHKEFLKNFLIEDGAGEVIDFGAHNFDADDDYPDYIKQAALAVSNDPENSRAIIFGGSGQGEAMLANHFPHVRAVVYYGGPHEIISLSREHNDANVLSVGARFVDESDVPLLVKVWLETPKSKDEKYSRRIKKAADLR